jgi:hypothetical protein
MSKFDFSKFEAQGSSGLDAFLESEPVVITPVKTAARIKVAKIADLQGFTRISNETLVRKSEQDLWSIKKEADGTLFIERMFDDNKPLSG